MRPKILALLMAWYGLLALGLLLIGWQCAVLMWIASCVTALIVAMATAEEANEDRGKRKAPAAEGHSRGRHEGKLVNCLGKLTIRL